MKGPAAQDKFYHNILRMADPLIQVPLWLLWGRTLCGALSIAGFVIHYNLRVRNRRKVKRTIVRFFVAVVRANRLARLSTAAAAVETGMRAIYGHRILRIAAISFLLSILYFVGAFFISGASLIDWKGVRILKARLEQTVDPILYSMPEAERQRVQEQECTSYPADGTAIVVCFDKYLDAAAVATRTRISDFRARYHRLIGKESAHTALTMLTLWEGTYLERDAPLPAISLFSLNIILDLSGVLLVMNVAGQLSKRSSLLRMLPPALISVVGSIVLASLSVFSYGLVDRGDVWGAGVVLGVLTCTLMIWMMVKGFREDPFEDSFLALALGMIGFVVGFAMLIVGWSQLSRPYLPVIHFGEQATWFFYLIAVGVVLPTLIGTVFVLAVVLFGASARTLLFPTLIYVRTVLRLPTPLLVTLTAAPFVVFQTLVSIWPDIHKMLGLH